MGGGLYIEKQAISAFGDSKVMDGTVKHVRPGSVNTNSPTSKEAVGVSILHIAEVPPYFLHTGKDRRSKCRCEEGEGGRPHLESYEEFGGVHGGGSRKEGKGDGWTFKWQAQKPLPAR